MAKPKRLLVIADMHCGHEVGLMPPAWDSVRERDKRKNCYVMRRTMWDWYKGRVSALKPDIIIVNGDAIDGRGEKSGGLEQMYPDRQDQVEMAIDCILEAKTRKTKVLMSYGTNYHTGDYEDFENNIANDDRINAVKIGGEDTADINGLLVNYRHHIGSSSIPHGRHTAIAKERLWNLLWAEHDEYPRADAVIRSHVHYHAGAFGPAWVGMTTPALQGYGTRYGSRRMSGVVHIGIVVFDIYGKDDFSWHVPILRLPRHEALSV